MRRAAFLLAASVAIAALLAASPAIAAEPVTAAGNSLRTGWYPDEPQLTPQLLEGGGFGRNFTTPVEGQIYAQPLVSGPTLFAATEANDIYGIDSQSGDVEWERNVGTPWNSAEIGCADLTPHVGITGTPVIDPNTNTAYFVAKGSASGGSSPADYKMHAVDLSNGEERQGFPVTIAGHAQNLPGLEFEPTHELQRTGLLLMDGVIYASFGSHCDIEPFQGWLVGVSTTGQIKAMWATTEHAGAGIWQSGGGLISDREGQILFASGNSWSPAPGPGDEPPEGHLGDSVVRVQVQSDGKLAAKDFFSPYNAEELDAENRDLGSGGPIALPSPYFGTPTFPHLMVAAGKTGVVYLLNRDELGGREQGEGGGNKDLGETPIPKEVFGSLAAWPGDGGYVYVPAPGEIPGEGTLQILRYGTDGTGQPGLTAAASVPDFEFGSGSPMVTSTEATAGSGILWIARCPEASGCEGSTFEAYSAVPAGGEAHLHLLWSEQIGVATKFARPDASQGRIYVGARVGAADGEILAFGPTHHTLTVTREAASGGSVRSDMEGIDCGSACSHSFANGAQVTLTATPAAHFEFAGWSGGGCSGTGPCRLTLYSDTTVTASFVPITHALTVLEAGAGTGTVVSTPAGIECGAICSARFPETSTVILEAVPGRAAVSWAGCTSATGRICEVKGLEADRAVTASFLPRPQTTIIAARISRARRWARFRFRGSDGSRAFQCRLIRAAGKRRRAKPKFRSCDRTKTFRRLRHGRYRLQVRAVNAAGPDPTPAQRRFRI